MDEIVPDCPCHPAPIEKEPITEEIRMLAVRVDQDGYLYAPVVQSIVDPQEVVLMFLDGVNPDEIETRALTDYPDDSPGAGFLKALVELARAG